MNPTRWIFHHLGPLALGSFHNWVRLLRENRGGSAAYASRIVLTSLLSLATAPLRQLERLRFERSIEATPIPAAPVFIIGHWRGGTTHLHNLMSLDKNLGYISTLQAIAPASYLLAGQTLHAILARILPPTRMMDNMTWSLDSPQEEEYALANLSPYSFYHHWSFPRRARDYFFRYALFREITQTVLARWKATYLSILRKATLSAGGRRLVVKNPTNTGRIRVLLDLFPDARFIHIYRNPYLVFPSTRRLYNKTLAITRLQEISAAEIDANILLFYREIMHRYLAERERIPPGNLVEVRYESLEADPLGELRRIYATLGLPGFHATEPAFRAYIDSKRSYQKNRYHISLDVIEKVEKHWGFALDLWGYRQPAGC